MRNLNITVKSQKNDGYTNDNIHISATKIPRTLKLESNHAMTIFYIHKIRYINKLTFLLLKCSRKIKILEKLADN